MLALQAITSISVLDTSYGFVTGKSSGAAIGRLFRVFRILRMFRALRFLREVDIAARYVEAIQIFGSALGAPNLRAMVPLDWLAGSLTDCLTD